MIRALPLMLVGIACGPVGVTVDVSTQGDVPPLDSLRVQVTQGSLLVAQTFPLAGKPLPQSIALVSKGMTRGTVDIVVQGLSQGTVEAEGTASAELQQAGSAMHVAVVLARFCPGMGVCGCKPTECAATTKSCGALDDGCGGLRDCGACTGTDVCTNNVCAPSSCAKKTCADLNATCGQAPDGCGGELQCGTCKSGTCGGGGVANQCGKGQCVPRTSCDAGVTCSTMSDGCSGVLSCGTCDAGMTCGGGGIEGQCGCTALTACPQGAECGTWPDGCGHVLSCGTCDGGTCGSDAGANKCSCTPYPSCPLGACGSWPDGCGGESVCPACAATLECLGLPGVGPDAGRCGCVPPLVACGGACVDTGTDPNNCGSCGNTCPGGQACQGGLCPCVDATSNSDGHCCPAGWQFREPFSGGTTAMRCYLGPSPATDILFATAQCQQATLTGYGRAVSAVGAGANVSSTGNAIPQGACGSFFQDPMGDVLVTKGTLNEIRPCSASCIDFPMCNCDTCNCMGGGQGYGCVQPSFCVMDALGPRVLGACTADYDCPPGDRCNGGNCQFAAPFCVVASDCDAGFTTCAFRGAGETGLCQ